MEPGSRTAIAQRAAAISAASTTVTVIVKVVAAILSHSISVLAESMQSILDIALSLAALYTLKLAAKPPDEDHPFGHGKAESLLSAFQMVLVMITSAVIAWQAALHLHEPEPIKPDFGLFAMGYSVLANIAIIIYLRKVVRQTRSVAIEGESEHLRSDTLASLGIIAGLVAYKFTGIRQIDPIVAIVFTLSGAYFAIKQLKKVLHPLMDGALPESDLEIIREVLRLHPESRGFHNVLTRETGLLRVVMLHVLLDDHLSFTQAHDIAEHIEQELSDALRGASVTVHYEPYEAEIEHRRSVHGD